MKIIGWLLLAISILLCISAAGMDTSVSSGIGRVHNIGLLQQQQNILLMGMFGILISIVMIFAGRKKSAPLPDAETSNDALRKCPFCAELIKNEAIKCKHCGSDVPPEVQQQPEPQPLTPEQLTMKKYGITHERGMYRLNGIGYDTLDAAISDAKSPAQ